MRGLDTYDRWYQTEGKTQDCGEPVAANLHGGFGGGDAETCAPRGVRARRVPIQSLSARVKERLEGAIQSSHRKDIRNAAQKACLLYEDIYQFILEEIVTYQNTKHSELGMSQMRSGSRDCNRSLLLSHSPRLTLNGSSGVCTIKNVKKIKRASACLVCITGHQA